MESLPWLLFGNYSLVVKKCQLLGKADDAQNKDKEEYFCKIIIYIEFIVVALGCYIQQHAAASSSSSSH